MDAHATGNVGNRTPTNTEILDCLNDLLQLNHDAVGAYEIAIEKLDDRDHADQIAGYKRDHERHIRELNEAITNLGGTPKNEPHATAPLKEGLQSLGGMAGDKGVLIAWRANELQVRNKYDRYASEAMFWADDLKRLVDRQALDEERHYEWVANVLQAMGVAPGEGLELDAATKAREMANRARATTANAADAARQRVAGGLDAAANRISHLVNQEETAEAGRMSGVANRVAGGMHSAADYVREGDLEDLRGGFEEQVRRSPLQTLAAAALAGFVIGRLLR